MKHLNQAGYVTTVMFLMFIAACGGSGGGGIIDDLKNNPSSVNISITQSQSMRIGETKTLNITRQNTHDFTLSAPIGSGCVKNSVDAVSCTPTATGTYTITVTATADTTKKASVTVTVTDSTATVPFQDPFEGEMVLVRGGTFTMGCTPEQGRDCVPDEDPAHEVTLTNDYYIGRYEVTQAQWLEVMENNPSSFIGNNFPVENVSWNEVQHFITKLNLMTGKNYRLPTEAEWEFAARGGNQSRGYKYSGSNNVNEVAWYSSNSGSKTHQVGTKKANELGIYDMSGNVFEWVNDWYGYYGSGAETNPQGLYNGEYRMPRGGSWGSDARSARVSYRFGLGFFMPGGRQFTIGFRLALSSE